MGEFLLEQPELLEDAVAFVRTIVGPVLTYACAISNIITALPFGA